MKNTYTLRKTAVLPILGLLATLALPAGMKAGSITDLGTTAPTPGSSDQSDLTPDNQGGGSNTYSNISGVQIGQSFTTGANSGGYSMTDFIFEINFNYQYSPAGTLTLPASVYLGNGDAGTQIGTTDSGTLTETALTTDGGADGHFLEFTFGTPLTLLPNTQYSFAVGQQTDSDGGAIKFQGTSDASTYTGGSAFETGDPADGNTPGGITDLVFDVGLTPVSAAVPEPTSTCAMLLGGAGFLLFGRRRRRAMA